MRRYWSYFKYVMRHKFYVLIASRKVGASLWLAITHDISKLRPSEWKPYSITFYKSNGDEQYNETLDFNAAWLLHQHRNPHHWQYWILRMDQGDIMAIEMPHKYVKEMVSDWMGAGKAMTGKWNHVEWYSLNRDKIILHNNTRKLVEELLKINVV